MRSFYKVQEAEKLVQDVEQCLAYLNGHTTEVQEFVAGRLAGADLTALKATAKQFKQLLNALAYKASV